MNGEQLLEKLAESGTGKAKIAVGSELLDRDPEASAEDVIEYMQSRGVNPITLGKAWKFVVDQKLTEAKQRDEAKAKQQAEAEAKKQAEAKAKQQAEAEAKKQAEAKEERAKSASKKTS